MAVTYDTHACLRGEGYAPPRRDCCLPFNGHPQSPCNQCPVCHFTLSPFTQAESFHIQIIIPLFNYEPVAYMGMKGYQPVHPYNLRAPPSLSALL